MGMDVFGRAPTSEMGKYFGNNIRWWHPLADYCKEVAPEIASGCRYSASFRSMSTAIRAIRRGMSARWRRCREARQATNGRCRCAAGTTASSTR